MAEIGAAVAWAQTQPSTTKFVITCVIVLLAACLVFILWQQPPPKETTPGSANQTGNVASAGQSGGITAGLYINNAPPVTDQQKAEALLSLQAEIQDLAAFPKRPDIPDPQTMLEQVVADKRAHQLFIILGKYYTPTIKSVPGIGNDLYNFKVNYYNLTNNELNFENTTSTAIGKIVSVRFRAAWDIYFRYFLLRSLGSSQQSIIDGGNFLNYGITWDDAEKVYGQLHVDTAIAQPMADNAASLEKLLEDASKLLSEDNAP